MDKTNETKIMNKNSKKKQINSIKHLEVQTFENKFCNSVNLSNEAEVESYFIDRLLKDLSFPDSDIKLKCSIEEFTIGQGSKKIKYKPDYIILVNGKPALIIEAKNPNEDINNWKSQCSSYCLELNRLQKENPVKYFMLSNGLNTILTPWDQDLEIFQLNFEDFTEGNEKYEKFKNFLERNKFIRIIKLKRKSDTSTNDISLEKIGDVGKKKRKIKSKFNSDLINDCIKLWNINAPSKNDPTLFVVREEVYKIFKEKEVLQDDIPLIKNLINSLSNYLFLDGRDLNLEIVNILYLLTPAKNSLEFINETWFDRLKNRYEGGNKPLELSQFLYASGYFRGLTNALKISIDDLDIFFFRFLINEYHIPDNKDIRKIIKVNRTEIISDLTSMRKSLEAIVDKSNVIYEFINKINDLIRNILKL